MEMEKGDVVDVTYRSTGNTYRQVVRAVNGDEVWYVEGGFDKLNDDIYFRIIYRGGSDTPKTWGEMTDAEKGALLLAWQRGETLQYRDCDGEEWRDTDIHPHEFDVDAYRVKPTPDRKTVTLGWEESLGVGNGFTDGDTYRITFDIIDGKPDCNTVKMEAVE